MIVKQDVHKQRYFKEEREEVFGIWESKRELMFQESFCSKYSDTTESGREMAPADQCPDGSQEALLPGPIYSLILYFKTTRWGGQASKILQTHMQ